MSPLLALLILGSVLTANASVKSTVSRSDFPEKTTLIIAKSSFVGSKLAYAYCDRSYDPVHLVNCKVYLDSLEGGSSSCQITLESTTTNGDVKANRERAQVLPFGSGDNVLFIWQEQPGGVNTAYIKFSTIQMSDCSVKETRLPFKEFDRDRAKLSGVLSSTDAVVVKDVYNRYSVMYHDRRLCAFKFCKVELDEEGNVVSTPKSWLEDEEAFTPGAMIRLPSTDRYVAVYGSLDDHELRIYVSWSYNNYPYKKIKSQGRITGYSLTSEGISACFVTKDDATCTQLDLNGYPQMNAVSVPLEQKPLSVVPFNLPEGGLLLLSIECPEPKYGSGCSTSGSEVYRVMKMNGYGEVVGSLKLDSIECNLKSYNMFSHFFVNKNGEECLALACYNDARYFKDPPMLNRFVNCWTKL